MIPMSVYALEISLLYSLQWVESNHVHLWTFPNFIYVVYLVDIFDIIILQNANIFRFSFNYYDYSLKWHTDYIIQWKLYSMQIINSFYKSKIYSTIIIHLFSYDYKKC